MGALTSHPEQPKIVLAADSTDAAIEKTIAAVLRSVRQHLQMDVGFVSEFVNGNRIVRYVDSKNADASVRAGRTDPLEDTYCQRVIDGRFPGFIPDTTMHPEAAQLPMTVRLPIGSHLGVPIRMPDGTIYGTFCCYSHLPNEMLDEQALSMMRVCADLAGNELRRDLASRQNRLEVQSRIQQVLDSDELSILFQPIYDPVHDRIVGFEALARFSAPPIRSPDVWFSDAAAVGLGVPLEIKAIETALQGLIVLPAEVYISVNLGPHTILAPAFPSLFENLPIERIVLEITEHALITDYYGIEAILRPLRARGLRLAVDDAGAGYASFRHILNLTPDLIKLDISLTQHINIDRSRRALAAALIRFAEETDCSIVAEGVETVAELTALRNLGVTTVQGYFIGRPDSLAAAIETCKPVSEIVERLGLG